MKLMTLKVVNQVLKLDLDLVVIVRIKLFLILVLREAPVMGQVLCGWAAGERVKIDIV